MRLNLAVGLALVGTSWAGLALAHGVEVEHRRVSSVEVQARFETGEPMANAQVLVYAPNDPSAIWQQGTTDDQGRFNFVPDETLTGNWEVMVRQAGHGAIATVPVAGGQPAASDSEGDAEIASEGNSAPGAEAESDSNSLISPSTTLSPVQRGITIGSVIWGFIGTALFFNRGKR